MVYQLVVPLPSSWTVCILLMTVVVFAICYGSSILSQLFRYFEERMIRKCAKMFGLSPPEDKLKEVTHQDMLLLLISVATIVIGLGAYKLVSPKGVSLQSMQKKALQKKGISSAVGFITLFGAKYFCGDPSFEFLLNLVSSTMRQATDLVSLASSLMDFADMCTDDQDVYEIQAGGFNSVSTSSAADSKLDTWWFDEKGRMLNMNYDFTTMPAYLTDYNSYLAAFSKESKKSMAMYQSEKAYYSMIKDITSLVKLSGANVQTAIGVSLKRHNVDGWLVPCESAHLLLHDLRVAQKVVNSTIIENEGLSGKSNVEVLGSRWYDFIANGATLSSKKAFACKIWAKSHQRELFMLGALTLLAVGIMYKAYSRKRVKVNVEDELVFEGVNRNHKRKLIWRSPKTGGYYKYDESKHEWEKIQDDEYEMKNGKFRLMSKDAIQYVDDPFDAPGGDEGQIRVNGKQYYKDANGDVYDNKGYLDDSSVSDIRGVNQPGKWVKKQDSVVSSESIESAISQLVEVKSQVDGKDECETIIQNRKIDSAEIVQPLIYNVLACDSSDSLVGHHVCAVSLFGLLFIPHHTVGSHKHLFVLYGERNELRKPIPMKAKRLHLGDLIVVQSPMPSISVKSMRPPVIGERVTFYWRDFNTSKQVSSNGVVGKQLVYGTVQDSVETFEYSGSTEAGSCGGLYVANTDGAIVGFHGLGTSGSYPNQFYPCYNGMYEQMVAMSKVTINYDFDVGTPCTLSKVVQEGYRSTPQIGDNKTTILKSLHSRRTNIRWFRHPTSKGMGEKYHLPTPQNF